MDKRTIIGLLLMGVVIFGFTWLNQPSEEELAARKKQEQQKELAESKKAGQDTVAVLDSLSVNDIALLKDALSKYGKESDGAHSVSFGAVSASLKGNELSGTVALDNDTIALNKVIDKSLGAVQYNEAVKILKNSISELTRYRNFASCLSGKDSTIVLQNKLLRVNVSTKGGVISQATLKDYKAYNEKEVTIFDKTNDSYSFVLNGTDTRFDTKDFYFAPKMLNDSTLLMALDLGEGVNFGIMYTLHPDNYIVKMEIVQQGMDKIIPTKISDMGFNWSQKMIRHEEGRMFEERNSGIFYKFAGSNDVDNLSEGNEDSQSLNEKIKWIGFKNQFFSSVIICDKSFSGVELKSVPFEKGSAEDQNFLKNLTASATLEYSSTQSTPASFNFFFGPNLYPLLSSYDNTISPDEDLKLTNLIPLGWSLFRWINTGIIIPIFDLLGRYISNYGIIILILTLLIKIVLFPLTYKSMMSQAKTRVLAPDIKAINEQYPGKENAMIRQQKSMELYSLAGASPLSGCLPMLLQMPILFAMFSFFPSCIELRGASFLWVKDLSAPDAIISWNAQIPFITNYFGNHISLFCLLMTVTNVLYTRINMQNQASSQSMPGMKIMMYMMPFMFLVFFNNYAAGLSYYYFISLLLTIIQTYAFRYFVDEKKVRATMAANAKKPKKKSGFMARLEEVQRQQQAALKAQQAQAKKNNGKGRK